MREILFRGKQRTMLDWVEGTGVFNDGTNTWLSANESNKPIACGLNHKIVLPETVGQFTGLTDKNGKKIFEGDIVRNGDYTMIVVWYDFHAAFMLAFRVDGDYFEAISNSHIYLEVIGNIHDNPELLGGGDDGT